MKNLSIVSILFMLFVVACGDKKEAELNSIEMVSADKFKSLLENEDVQLIDVRTNEEFEEGYIENAALFGIHEDDFIQKATQKLNKSKPVLLYCKAGGLRSVKAAEELKAQGYQKIYNLEGGILAWQEKGYTVTALK